jgi:hypothetical protein
MKRFTSRLHRTALAATALLMLGGCVYGPGYYPRSNVVYDDGRVSGPAYSDDYYSDGYYASPGYYYGPSYYGYGPGYYYDPWWPVGLGIGFYGGYSFGGHHHGGHGGYSHGGHGGGSHHGH